MERWRNWSGRLTAEPATIHVHSEEDAAALAAQVAELGGTIRPVGSAHSHYPLVRTDGTGVTLADMSASVTGARLATTCGEVVSCSAGERTDLWQAVRLNLGALGIVTAIQRWDDWWRVRDELDPSGAFLNDEIRTWRDMQ
jgi:FAD/FMN-containing dehydrogenase